MRIDASTSFFWTQTMKQRGTRRGLGKAGRILRFWLRALEYAP